MTLLANLPPDICENRCRTYPGKEGLKAILQAISQADIIIQQRENTSPLAYNMIVLPDNDFTVLPLPDNHAWQIAIEKDHDTSLLINHISSGNQLEEKDLVDKTYFNLYRQNRFDVQDLRKFSNSAAPSTLAQSCAHFATPYGYCSLSQFSFWWSQRYNKNTVPHTNKVLVARYAT